MPIERSELDDLFNSANNEVEDDRVKGYDERSKQSNEDMAELEQSIQSNDLPSILDEATVVNDVEDLTDTDEITLDDLIGEEDLNICDESITGAPSERVDVPSDEEINEAGENFDNDLEQEPVSASDLEFTTDDDDDEISLDDLMGDGEKKTEVKAEKTEVQKNEYRVPLDFDFDEDESEDEGAVDDATEDEDSGQEETETEVVEIEEPKVDIMEHDVAEQAVTAEIATDIKDVCTDPKYLNDPRYAEFYRQKLRAYNFLKLNVPRIDYAKLRKEMEESHVSVSMEGVMSLDEFNEKIQQVQAVRNRLTKVKSLCIQSYVPMKRVVRMLEDCLMKESTEKSNDKRSGEIQIHMAEMEYDLALSEAFLKDVDQIIENITSAHEALSRQITVLQERNREIQRGQEPYIDSTQNEYDSVLAEDDDDEEKLGAGDINKKWQDVM